jgi:hypothetical protein
VSQGSGAARSWGIIKRDPETHPTGNPRKNLKRHSQQPPSRTRNVPFPLIPHITMQFCHRRSDSSIDAGVPYGTGVREGVRRRPVRQSRSMPMTKSHFSYVQARTFSPFLVALPIHLLNLPTARMLSLLIGRGVRRPSSVSSA